VAFEEKLLRALLQPPRIPLPAGIVGPGDDACVVPVGGSVGRLLASCDALEEGVHFRQGWLSLEDLAHKLVAVNLSDVAAMGGEPFGILASIAWPSRRSRDDAERFGRALQDACEAHACPLLGGDTDVRDAPLRVEATVLARCERPLLRSGGRAGDRLFVSGPLGGAALAVASWDGVPLPEGDDALGRFRRPVPRLDVGRAVRDLATAAIDLSDGLRSDAARLAASSGLAARLHAHRVPLHPSVPDADRELALSGGEDYELLVAGPAEMVSACAGLVEIGELVHGEPGRLRWD
jgi:thiamine-monophosphate kinase